MANAILLRPTQITALKKDVNDFMKTTKWGSWKAYVEAKENREDFNPIRIRDDAQGQRWILSLAVKSNPKFQKLKQLTEDVSKGIEVVTITKDDLPEYKIDGPTDYTKVK